MAIQTRRGAYNDFDPEKMLPGEWASVTSGDPGANDGRSVYMCFAPGDVKRMATYEDMQENISEATEDIREQFTEGVESATQAATSAADQATAAASTAEDAADRANDISESIEQAVDGTLINDASASSLTVYSSKKSEETFVKKMDVIDIEHGGTGATYPVAARIALGAVGTDDIIQISKGGTGAVSPAVARQNLGAMAADKIIPIDQGGGGGTTAQESAKNIMDDASTEWHDLPLASGATPGPYRKPQYRIIGNHVFVSGDVAITINGTTLALIAQLPEGYGPPGNVYKGAMATGFQLGRLLIGSARNLYVEWVYSLQTGNRFDGQLSWICIDMDWYVDTQASPANIIAAENEVSNDTA